MVRTEHPLLSPSLGHQKTLVSFHYGDPSARPKVYLQASLHAEELPGMLVAHHLRPALEQAEREGRLRGHVVLVPAANPIGLAQRLDHKAMGRFEFETAQNFNFTPYVVAAMILVPLAEVFFRGFAFAPLARRYDKRSATVVSGALYALTFGTPVALLLVFSLILAESFRRRL